MTRKAILAAGAVLVLTMAAAGAENGTTVDELAANAIGGTVEVTGTATFAGIDPGVRASTAQDHLGGPAGLLGYEIEDVLVGQPDPMTGDLVFVYDMADLTSSSVPEVIQYYWDFGLRIDGLPAEDFQISGKVSTLTSPLEPSFVLEADCFVEDSFFDCADNLGPLDAEADLDAGTIAITVPRDVLEDYVGASISGGRIVYVDLFGGITAQPSGVVVNVSNVGYAITWMEDYPIAGPSVTVTLAPEDGDALSADATLDDGAFAAVFDDVPAGTYEVTAEACFGDRCGSATTEVVVADASE